MPRMSIYRCLQTLASLCLCALVVGCDYPRIAADATHACISSMKRALADSGTAQPDAAASWSAFRTCDAGYRSLKSNTNHDTAYAAAMLDGAASASSRYAASVEAGDPALEAPARRLVEEYLLALSASPDGRAPGGHS